MTELKDQTETKSERAPEDFEKKYLYLYADFENFKKRASQERNELLKFGWEPVSRELLEVTDNLKRAIRHLSTGCDSNLWGGIELTLNQLKSILRKQGVEEVTSIGQPFDPALHESIGEKPSNRPDGIVLEEESPGYTLHGRLLRPARVIISRQNQAA